MSAFSQDITGYWQGVLYQISGSSRIFYPYSMQITQAPNGNVTGTTYLSQDNSKYYARHRLTGTFAHSEFDFRTQIIDQVPAPGNYWCAPVGQLFYDEPSEKLNGPWNAPNCSSGAIELWRLKIVSNDAYCSGEAMKVEVAGENVKWYTDSTLKNRVATGNILTPVIDTTTIFYVTQTHYNTESPGIPITVRVKPRSYFTINKTICPGESYLGYNTTGTFRDTFVAASGCDSIRILNLTVLAKPVPDLGKHKDLCTGDSLKLSPGQYATYLWQDGSVKSSLMVYKQGTYSVTVTNACGLGKDEVVVTERNCNIYFPNAFTPNNDGRNDIFRVLNGFDLKDYHLVIYNKWGSKLFETRDPRKGWDGMFKGIKQEQGIYLWFCEYIKDGVHTQRKGVVTLLH